LGLLLRTTKVFPLPSDCSEEIWYLKKKKQCFQALTAKTCKPLQSLNSIKSSGRIGGQEEKKMEWQFVLESGLEESRRKKGGTHLL